MAIHVSLDSLIQEALVEYMAIADYCIMVGKPSGGCYGFPAALMLFCIVDAIGSYHRKNKSFEIMVDGKKRIIQGDQYENFFILNSDYYGQQGLGEDVIADLYGNYRCLLAHNAALRPNFGLDIGNPSDPPFPIQRGAKCIKCVNLRPFADLSRCAVTKFLRVAPSIVPQSKRAKAIMR